MGYTAPQLYVKHIAPLTQTYGLGVTTDDLEIYANLVDTTPWIKLFGGAGIRNNVSSGYAFEITEGAGVNLYQLTHNAGDLEINGMVADHNLFLNPLGTGKVKFGTYVAGVKADSIGYIEVLDSGGTSRRLMVQSA